MLQVLVYRNFHVKEPRNVEDLQRRAEFYLIDGQARRILIDIFKSCLPFYLDDGFFGLQRPYFGYLNAKMGKGTSCTDS